jgi:signal transduction histidine kinase/CheY-like chemotaxis protein
MSAQDSYLNTTSSLIANDMCKQVWPNLSDKAQLTIARISCIAVTSLALFVSFAKDSVLGTFWLAENFWDPLVTVPLIAGLLGLRILKKDFVYLAIVCTLAVIGTRVVTGTFDTRSFSVGVTTSIFAFYIARSRFKALNPEADPSKIPSMLAYLKIILTTRTFNSGSVYVFCITILMSVTATIFISSTRYDLFIHISSAVLCVLLLFNELWSYKVRGLLLRKLWYCTLLCCLPLASSYSVFIGKFDSVLALNFVLSLCLLYMLVSPVTFVILTGVGTGLGYFSAIYSTSPFIPGVNTHTFGLYSCFFTVVSILMQIYNKSYVSRAVHTEVARVLQDKVAERTAELQLALVAKKEFLSKVSHEVRTPLQGIIGVSQELVESWESLKDNEKYDLAKVIARSGDRLMELMSNILDLSKFTAGQIEPKFEPNVNVTQLIEDAIKYGEKLVISQSKNISFKTEIGSGITTRIECDAMRIRQMLVNLINNAVSYSKSGEIVVRVGSDNGQLLVSVIDQGVGIPDNEKIMIFEAFTQSSLTHDLSKGKGLGLALCREIINMHNGRIWVESNEDSGSRFSFSIPYEQTTKGQTQAIGSKAASLKILLVDDEPICLQAGGMYMSSMGFEVVTVSGGVPALEYLKAHPNDIDLVLLDLMMPDMYGLNVLEAIKADYSLQHIHVVIQSGLLDGHEIEKAKRLGASGFLPKPYNKAMINNTIVKLLQPEDYAEAA